MQISTVREPTFALLSFGPNNSPKCNKLKWQWADYIDERWSGMFLDGGHVSAKVVLDPC